MDKPLIGPVASPALMAEVDELRNATGVLKEFRLMLIILVLLNIALTIGAFI